MDFVIIFVFVIVFVMMGFQTHIHMVNILTCKTLNCFSRSLTLASKLIDDIQEKVDSIENPISCLFTRNVQLEQIQTDGVFLNVISSKTAIFSFKSLVLIFDIHLTPSIHIFCTCQLIQNNIIKRLRTSLETFPYFQQFFQKLKGKLNFIQKKQLKISKIFLRSCKSFVEIEWHACALFQLNFTRKNHFQGYFHCFRIDFSMLIQKTEITLIQHAKLID